MKHCIFLTFSFFLFQFAFSQTKVYKGVINEKYKIEMHLNFINKSVHGYYFYKSKNIPIALFGEVEGTQIRLVEYDLIDSSMFFEGVISGSQINGQWQNADTKKKLSFSVDQIESKERTKHFLFKNGNYSSVTNSSKYSTYCSVYYIDKNLFYYEFSVGTYNCDGQVFGIAKLEIDGKAKSLKTPNTEGNCLLKFKFDKNKVKVEEGDGCESYHGASCTFGGQFINK